MGKPKKNKGEALQRAGGNMQKLQEGMINELVQVLTEEEPLKQRRRDILASAKDEGLDTWALAQAAKFKYGDAEQRRRAQEKVRNLDAYLCAVQLNLFAAEPDEPKKNGDKNLH